MSSNADEELIRSARGIASEFNQVGREHRTQEVLRELAHRLQVGVEQRDIEREAVALIGLAIQALGDGLYKAGRITDPGLRMQVLLAAQDEARAVLRADGDE